MNIEDELSKRVATKENADIKPTITYHSIHHPNHDILNHPHPAPESTHTHDDLTAAVPTVTIVELPSKPGCRSFSHKTCLKIPIFVPKNVPYEECRDIPAVECFFVLKTVDDIECSPTSYEDCTDTAVDVPYLDQEELCEDIEYDDCVDVEEQVPIQVCTVKHPQRKPIRRGEIEGTKKRKGGRKTGVVSKPARGSKLEIDNIIRIVVNNTQYGFAFFS